MPESTAPLVGIVMGSDSDWPKIKAASDTRFTVNPANQAQHQNAPV